MPVFLNNYQKYCDRKLDIIDKYFKKEDSILDAGCGDINHPYVFKRLSQDFNVTGVDIGHPWNPKIKKGDISNLNFLNGYFDVVICLDVLEHIKDWKKVLNELLRVAKKRVIISVPTTENKLFFKISQFFRKLIGINNIIFAGHFRDYFSEEIMHIAKEKGFVSNLIKIKFATPFFADILFKTKLRYGGIFIIDKPSAIQK